MLILPMVAVAVPGVPGVALDHLAQPIVSARAEMGAETAKVTRMNVVAGLASRLFSRIGILLLNCPGGGLEIYLRVAEKSIEY